MNDMPIPPSPSSSHDAMVIYPAIDVRDGRVVRLRQGDYAQETRYPADPLTLAAEYRAAGAQWLHLVDLNAARAGGYTLAALLSRIVADTGLAVQTGGGVREADDVARLLDAGATRVVVGSIAISDPARVCGWLQYFGGERITLALDTRFDGSRWQLPVHGWTADSEADLDGTLQHYAGSPARHLLCTDIGRDGMLSGPNLALYALLRQRYPAMALQASGGIRDIGDLQQLQRLGVAGAVTGKAVLDGRLSLSAALAC